MSLHILNVPPGTTLTEHFDSLNIFDKRELLNELEDIKNIYKNSIVTFHKWWAVVIACSILSLAFFFSWWILVYYILLNGFMGFIWWGNWKKVRKFTMVIKYLTSRL